MNQPIGYIDSGVGGLTVVKTSLATIANQEIVYIGDEARMPYGTRTSEEIIKFTDQMVNFLVTQKKIKLLVIACNTATARAMPTISKKYQLPIVGVIEPGALMAAKVTKSKKIGVLATQATVDSNAYPNALHQIDDSFQVTQLAASNFVELVESGDYKTEIGQKIVDQTLANFNGFDTLILGCTHFPIIEDLIQKAVGDSVQLINPAIETVNQVATILKEDQSIDFESVDKNNNQFFTTGSLQRFEKIADDWLQEEINVQQLKVVDDHLEEE